MIKKAPILALLILAATAGTAAAECLRSAVSGASQPLPMAGSFDATLLDRAILSEANYQRCLSNRRPLQPLGKLRVPAQGHSLWMARADKLSHKSSVAGRRTLEDRITSTGLPVNRASENIAEIPLFDLTPRFRVVDARSCRFAAPNGKNLGPHSYTSFARKVVSLWMASPGHRRNLLSNSTSYMAAAAVLSPDSEYCGNVYVTQIFAG